MLAPKTDGLATLTPMPLLPRLHQMAYWVTKESRPALGPEQTVVAVRQPFSPKGAARA